MLKNYFKTAFRNLIKHRFYTLINLLGLSVGLAACLLIFFWVQDELSYDRHNKDLDQLYRLYISFNFKDYQGTQAVFPGFIAQTFKNDFPEIEQAGRYRHQGSGLLTFGSTSFKAETLAYADSTLFQVLSLSFIKGDPEHALRGPNSILLNESIAKKIFGEEDPLGQLLVLDQDKTFKVSGVFKDMPANTHFNYNVFASVQSLDEPFYDTFRSHNSYTYVKLHPGVSPRNLEAKIQENFVRKKYEPGFLEAWGKNWEELTKESGQEVVTYHLEAVKNIHLYSEGIGPGSDKAIEFVYIFSAIALIILTIASINYMNLATARSTNRAKEVGIRKTLGAYRAQLKKQFITESFILSLFALAISLIFLELALPAFNQLANKSLNIHYWGNWKFGFLCAGLIFLLTFLAGAYPAFYLSAFNPSSIIKGGLTKGKKGQQVRNLLVVIQFSISIFLIVGTIIIFKQIKFVQQADLGFNKKQVLILKDAYGLGKNIRGFKEEVLRNPLFKSASITGYIPVDNYYTDYYRTSYWSEEGKTELSTLAFTIDHDYFNTYGMELASGRFFSPEFSTDSTAVVINETAAKILQLENPIGTRISSGDQTNKEFKVANYYTIVGVVKDFHFQSMRNEIFPIVMHLGNNSGMMGFQIEESSARDAMAFLKQKWNKMAPGQPFSYTFLDDQFNQLYQGEQRTAKIMAIFSGLAIFIACLGLFALAAFTAEQRKKEIGVRKVLGSSVFSIVLLLSRDFAKLILIAFIIASPFAWYVMNDWLEGFAYRTSIGIGVFLIAIGL
ncbi:ABC transporter permease, partial [Xanthovirga aplysinae]|uniref:ABC transporter permease n=1 Tax=Xanthovirga aplysinae TaxID=2529853 RepID=UPI0012BD05FB